MKSLPALLIVEDEDDYRDCLLEVFRREYHVIPAASGQKALDIVQSDTPIDAVILDIFLTDMSGLDLIDAIRKSRSRKTPFIVVLSGFSDDDTQAKAREKGADTVLTKIIRNQDLKDVVNKGISQSSS
ncbi:MAG: putative two-component system response regulator [Candidatus Marinamargulisbacteria bacterium]|jgi:putative two-component system response regulator